MVLKSNECTFEIPDVINNYKIFIEKCCFYISDVHKISHNFKQSAKFKLVIMELLTNAMKHSKTNSFIQIIKLDSQLVIKKIDYGRRFSFKDALTNQLHDFPFNFIKNEIIINALLGNNYELPILLKSNSKVEFLKPEEVLIESVFDIPEHYGLKIIRQCSDSFHYSYDESSNQNVFEVIFDL